MKITTFSAFSAAVLGLALVWDSSQARAQGFVFDPADLMLGIRPTDGLANDFEVNLGSRAGFLKQDGATVPLGNLASGLSSAGLSLNNLALSISGTVRNTDLAPGYPLQTLWVTRSRDITPDVQTDPWLRGSANGQSVAASRVRAIGNNALSFAGSVTTDTPSTVIVPDANASAYSKQSGSTGNLSGTFQGPIEGLTSAAFSSGTTPLRLDLYELQPGSGPGTYMGYFELGTTGDLSYTASISAVPEPEAYGALAGLGLLGFAIWRRCGRAQTAAASER